MALMKTRRGALAATVAGNALYPLLSQGALTVAQIMADSRRTESGSLTLSAGVITDVTRLAGVEGDGAAYPDSSVGVWPAATNLITNGGFETNTTGWSTGGSNTVASATTRSKFGSASGRVTYSNNDQMLYKAYTFSGAGTYTLSAWVYVPSDYDGTYLLFGYLPDYAGSSSSAIYVPFGARDTWVRITSTFTIDAGDLSGHIHVLHTGGQNPTVGKYVEIDGIQLEAGSIATPYIETDGGTASRVAGRITVPASGILTATQGWFIARTKAGFAAAGPGYAARLFAYGDATDDGVWFQFASGDWGMVSDAAGGAAAAASVVNDAGLVLGDSRTVYGGWKSDRVNATTGTTAWPAGTARTEIPTISSTVIDIGSMSAFLAAREAACGFDWVAMGSGVYTEINPAVVGSWGNTDPSVSDFPAAAQLTFLAAFNDDGTAYTKYSNNYRESAIQGDGATYPASMVGVWPAATNLVTNGNATTNTTGWTLGGTASLARVTDDGKFGTTCFKWTIGATPAGDGNFCAATLTGATAGRTFTIGRWLKGVGGSVGKTVRLVSRESGGASGTATVAIAEFTLTSDWQLCSATGSVTENDRTSLRNDIIIGSTGTPVTTADEIKFGGVSIFESAINMPYIETDGGTASRVAGRIQAPASVLDETQMWFFARTKMDHASTALPASFITFFEWGDNINNRVIFYYDGSLRCIRRNNAGSGTSPSTSASYANGDSKSFGLRLNATTTAVSADGGAWSSGANTDIPVLAATLADIGAAPISASAVGWRTLASNFVWAAAGIGTLTDADAALFHAWGNNDPLPHQFPRSAQLTFLAHFNGDGTAYRYAA